jgi:aspartate-semialdehyde dehydrogenase
MKESKIPVAVLGATGSVGQRFVELLANHPWFEVVELCASDRSAGKKYKDAVNWIMATPIPPQFENMIVKKCETGLKARVLFSGLDSSVAGDIEKMYTEDGSIVISNARNHRFDKDVPLIIPEINYEHLELIKSQKYKGAIVTNPNCSTIGMAMALKPLMDNFGIETVNVTTLQAVSGAGYPGLSGLDILDNVVPYIGGEEEKMETEPLKIFGKLKDDSIEYADIKISAQCNRVAVLDGHTENIQIKLKTKAEPKDIIEAWNNFRSAPQELNLPSAPEKPIVYLEQANYPQPRIHRNLGGGMSISVGRLRECSLFDYKFVALSHNTIRGAAGGTILIAELMKAKGYFDEL